MSTLSQDQINERLSSMNGWVFENNAIHTAFEFENFKEAFTIMTRIAFEAERLNHHPDWSNVYNRIDISLSTHDAGGVTEKDFELAETIDQILA